MKNAIIRALHLVLIAAIILARLSVYMARLIWAMADSIGNLIDGDDPDPAEFILTVITGLIFLFLVTVSPWLIV